MSKVLIVDDNIQNCDILEDVITIWGYQVFKAYQGKEAIELALKHKPDIILLDVMLPGMNGFEVCNFLKNNFNTKDIIIIMLTVLNDVEDRKRGFKVGANLFISKPIDYEELKTRLDSLINFKKKYDEMEELESVSKSFLSIIKKFDIKIYENIVLTEKYAKNISSFISLDEEIERKMINAINIIDIGKLFSNSKKELVSESLEITSSLKCSSWLDDFVLNFDRDPKGLPIEHQILIVSKEFANNLQNEFNKEEALTLLMKKYNQDNDVNKVVNALKQVLEDERFIENFNK